jgi:hypothetical protein
MPWQLWRAGAVPLREATRTVLPFLERRGAMREDILPVPPVRRIVPLVVDILRCVDGRCNQRNNGMSVDVVLLRVSLFGNFR